MGGNIMLKMCRHKIEVLGNLPQLLVLLVGVIVVGSGCATAKIEITARDKKNLVEPDFVLVHELAFAPKQIKPDQGIVTQTVKDLSGQSLSQQELEIGRSAAKALADGIVENLRKAGIPAFKAGERKPTNKTLVLTGKFVRIDQGNRAVRVLLGFGFGNGDIRAIVECRQGGRFIAEASVVTLGSLKPGLAASMGASAAAGAASMVVSGVVGGASAGGSELLLTTVEADAKRAAQKIAEKVVQGYINHGWASPDALNKMNALF